MFVSEKNTFQNFSQMTQPPRSIFWSWGGFSQEDAQLYEQSTFSEFARLLRSRNETGGLLSEPLRKGGEDVFKPHPYLLK